MKAFIYKTYTTLVRHYWSLTGGRNANVFGERLLLNPDTVFPNYRTHRLPAGNHKARIVRYADYVQMHAICEFIEHAKKPINIIEVGAHHGAYAVLLGKLLQKNGGTLIAIEPHLASFLMLEDNISRNDLQSVVTCLQVGVSDKAGKLGITNNGSESQITTPASSAQETVDVITLSDVIKRSGLSSIDMLLIDVEGAELPVLKGFPWERMPIPKLFVELHPYAFKDFGYTNSDLQMFLSDRNLRCLDMYLKEIITIEHNDYIGPTLIFK
jgi:FkbM family methyltransferase